MNNEKVTELLTLVLDSKTKPFNERAKLVNDWLEANKPAQVAVGLSAQNVYELSIKLSNLDTWKHRTQEELRVLITDFVAKEVTRNLLNWDYAPKEADIGAIMTVWFDKKGNRVGNPDYQHYQESRPLPRVEENQIWTYDDEDVRVIALGKRGVLVTVAYQYIESEVIEIRPYDEFISKFTFMYTQKKVLK
jgi:hypothetical protein